MTPETIVQANGSQVVLIHFSVDGHIVCMPNLAEKHMCQQKERQAPHMRTGEKNHVTCPMCRRTREWEIAKP